MRKLGTTWLVILEGGSAENSSLRCEKKNVNHACVSGGPAILI